MAIVRKLFSELTNPISYWLPLGDAKIPLNERIGSPLTLVFEGKIECIGCGRIIKKSFQQGYCFPCTQKLAACDFCILKPEKCHFHLGTCREPEWGKQHCMQPHIVYLANTSGLKVGITRKSQIPTRWVDQGATEALPIMQVDSRYQSGLIEVALGKHVADKTDWRKMLKGQQEKIDLFEAKENLLMLCKDELARHCERSEAIQAEKVIQLTYPVTRYPTTIQALSFDKTPEIRGILLGIRGQYLIFDCGILNIRKFTGYKVAMI